jgi:hypothetical protein
LNISDAAQTIGPVVKLLRELAAKNHGDPQAQQATR